MTPPVFMPPISCLSMTSSVQPTTQGLSMARATTAAWLVAPPVWVRMPIALAMPAMSSGLVSWVTRITGSVASTASLALNTGRPTATPGQAGRPMKSGFSLKAGSIIGRRTALN